MSIHSQKSKIKHCQEVDFRSFGVRVKMCRCISATIRPLWVCALVCAVSEVKTGRQLLVLYVIMSYLGDDDWNEKKMQRLIKVSKGGEKKKSLWLV